MGHWLSFYDNLSRMGSTTSRNLLLIIFFCINILTQKILYADDCPSHIFFFSYQWIIDNDFIDIISFEVICLSGYSREKKTTINENESIDVIWSSTWCSHALPYANWIKENAINPIFVAIIIRRRALIHAFKMNLESSTHNYV